MASDRHVRRNAAAYTEALASLLPTGLAWPRHPDSAVMKAVKGLAGVWQFVDSRAADLLEQESDPRITIELLTDWERNWGLPEDCFLGSSSSIRERQKTLVMKMTLIGGQSRTFFIWVAAQLGNIITITEFSPFMVGVSRVGDTRPRDTSPNILSGAFGVF